MLISRFSNNEIYITTEFTTYYHKACNVLSEGQI